MKNAGNLDIELKNARNLDFELQNAGFEGAVRGPGGQGVRGPGGPGGPIFEPEIVGFSGGKGQKGLPRSRAAFRAAFRAALRAIMGFPPDPPPIKIIETKFKFEIQNLSWDFELKVMILSSQNE